MGGSVVLSARLIDVKWSPEPTAPTTENAAPGTNPHPAAKPESIFFSLRARKLAPKVRDKELPFTLVGTLLPFGSLPAGQFLLGQPVEARWVGPALFWSVPVVPAATLLALLVPLVVVSFLPYGWIVATPAMIVIVLALLLSAPLTLLFNWIAAQTTVANASAAERGR